MIFLPETVTFKDLFVKSSITTNNLFVINFRSFYQKAPIIKQGDEYVLKSKNCFFLMDAMHKDITNQMMKKYSEMDIN